VGTRSYAQAQVQGGSLQGWWWAGPPTAIVELPSGMPPISCLLSTGELLSIHKGVGRVYDPDGGLLASFPTGNLRFVSEDYVGGVLSVVFCLPDADLGSLYFDVYSIPTASIKSLAQ
jgi:hypothetical protein